MYLCSGNDKSDGKERDYNNYERELFACGEAAHARPIANELAWLSLNRCFGQVKSFVNSLTIFHTDQKDFERRHLCRRSMAIYGFACRNAREAALFIYSLNMANKEKK